MSIAYFLTKVFPLQAPSPLRWYIYFKTRCLRAFLQSSLSSVGSPDNTVNERNSLGNLIHIRAGDGAGGGAVTGQVAYDRGLLGL